MFECKTGEHCILTDVYYIPQLTANILSIGQLVENGCQVLIDGDMLKIRDVDQWLLVRVRRSPSRLYTLYLKTAQSVCPSTKSTEVVGDGMRDMGIFIFKR